MNIVNLTPHKISLYFTNVKDKTRAMDIEPSGTVARVSVTRERVGSVNVNGASFPVNAQVYGGVENLPAPQDGTLYIVSALVLSALAGSREDVVAPDTGAGAVRDADNKIIGTLGFVK